MTMMGQGNTGTAPDHGVNMTPRDEFVEKLTKEAEKAGSGEDALAKSLMLTCDYAHKGVLNMERHRHGTGIDDAWYYAGLYWEKRNKAAVFGTKKGSERKLASLFRSMVKVGCITTLGPSEPITSVNKLLTKWRELHGKKENSGKLKDAANTLVDYARKQIGTSTLLTQQELSDLCYLPKKEDKTIEDVLMHIKETASKLYSGKHDAGVAHTSEVLAIVDNASALLRKLEQAKVDGTEIPGIERP